MIEIKQVTKTFGSHVALEDVTLSLHAGKIYGLWGPNGAGKSTLLRLILGTLKPNKGAVRVLGQDPVQAWELRKEIGTLQESDDCFVELTVREYLWWVGRLRGLNNDRSETELKHLAETFYFSDWIDSLIGDLSYGNRRKVLIAAALVASPKLLLLDEPSNGLDVQSLQSLIRNMDTFQREGGASVIVSHHWTFLSRICSEIIFFDSGKIIKQARPEMCTEPGLGLDV